MMLQVSGVRLDIGSFSSSPNFVAAASGQKCSIVLLEFAECL